MISEKSIKALEFEKILSSISKHAILEDSKNLILNLRPDTDIKEVKHNLTKTVEAYKLLFTHNATQVPFFASIRDSLSRAEKGATLTMAELLEVASNLQSARIVKNNFQTINDDEIVFLKDLKLVLRTLACPPYPYGIFPALKC